MDGKKQKCGWCEGNMMYAVGEDGIGIFVKVLSGELSIHSPSQCKDFEFEIPIKYCPMCGKKF